MSYLEKTPKDYTDGRTKQSFKDSTDINKLIYRHAKAGTLSHLEKFGGQYGDFSDFDFFTAQTTIARAKSVFEALPAEIRKEFSNDPSQFFEFVGTKSDDELREALPAIAQKGKQLPDFRPTTPPGTMQGAASEPKASVPSSTEPAPSAGDTGSPEPSQG